MGTEATATEDTCTTPQWVGDNYCDDNLNTAECHWDGGDCCGDDVKTNYCDECQCLDPNEITTTESTTAEAPTTEATATEDTCTNPQWVGDNYCDDNLNTAECDWDGGDCCGD